MTKLEQMRTAKEWTLTQVAAKIGTVAATVLNWEAGKSAPRATHLLLLCEAWDCEPADLIGEVTTDIKAEMMA